MDRSWTLGSLFGIRIAVHVTFVLVLALAALQGAVTAGPAGALAETTLVTILFAFVVAHELGHALMARRFGARTDEIVLLPIGGIARIDRELRRPSDEILVALAGPAVNMAFATLLVPLWMAAGAGDGLLARLLSINVGLALFNLLPAFPMDGGRVLRAALATTSGHEEATRLAATIGQVLAVAMGFFGLVFSPWLAVIALFIWTAATAEKESVRYGHDSLVRLGGGLLDGSVVVEVRDPAVWPCEGPRTILVRSVLRGVPLRDPWRSR